MERTKVSQTPQSQWQTTAYSLRTNVAQDTTRMQLTHKRNLLEGGGGGRVAVKCHPDWEGILRPNQEAASHSIRLGFQSFPPGNLLAGVGVGDAAEDNPGAAKLFSTKCGP